jgi:hypothetical protein
MPAVRIPNDLLAEVDAWSEKNNKDRSWAFRDLLQRGISEKPEFPAFAPPVQAPLLPDFLYEPPTNGIQVIAPYIVVLPGKTRVRLRTPPGFAYQGCARLQTSFFVGHNENLDMLIHTLRIGGSANLIDGPLIRGRGKEEIPLIEHPILMYPNYAEGDVENKGDHELRFVWLLSAQPIPDTPHHYPECSATSPYPSYPYPSIR